MQSLVFNMKRSVILMHVCCLDSTNPFVITSTVRCCVAAVEGSIEESPGSVQT